MFQIGEFSRIARVSTRQLRHYDELGLLKPVRIDAETGYRYYSALQLPRLNRILALKDLGLTLDQIARLLDDDISAAEIHGMLTMKKAQVEQALRDELARIRNIEERIGQIEAHGRLNDDVVLKSVPVQKFLSLRQVVASVHEGFSLIHELHRLLPLRSERSSLGNFGLIFHSESFDTSQLDVEMGFLLEQDFLDTLALPDGRVLTMRTLPAVATMATLIRTGIHPGELGVNHYGALGTWIETNGFQLAGPGREVFIQPFIAGKEHEAVIEIQLPVTKIEPGGVTQLSQIES
jgi:DNA-binding transcriptional MerR regulator